MTVDQLNDGIAAYKALIDLQTYQASLDAESEGAITAIRTRLTAIGADSTIGDDIKAAIMVVIDAAVTDAETTFAAV